MTTGVKYGVIGCGHLGTYHAQKAAALAETDLVAVYDIDRDRTQAVAEANGCKPCRCIEELLDLIDAVSIVVPTTEHYSECMCAFEAGKHVLLEKPITETVAEAQELISAARSRGLKLQVGHIERFNPVWKGLDLLPDVPRFVEAHRLAQFNPRGLDVAVIFDLMIHDIDLVLHVMKSTVKEVHASAVAVISDRPDIANARLEFANGAVANLTASRISVRKMRKLRLFARDNYLSLDFLEKKTEHFLLADRECPVPDGYFGISEYEPTGRKILVGTASFSGNDALAEEIRSFAIAVATDGDVPVNADDASKALEIALRIEAVAKEGLDRVLV